MKYKLELLNQHKLFRFIEKANIPIEQRNPEEVKYVVGAFAGDAIGSVLITPPESPAANFAFDVTPARLVTGIITERGVAGASEEGLASLFPDMT